MTQTLVSFVPQTSTESGYVPSPALGHEAGPGDKMTTYCPALS